MTELSEELNLAVLELPRAARGNEIVVILKKVVDALSTLKSPKWDEAVVGVDPTNGAFILSWWAWDLLPTDEHGDPCTLNGSYTNITWSARLLHDTGAPSDMVRRCITKLNRTIRLTLV